MEKFRDALSKEADIIRLIRSQRFVHLALKHLLDPGVRKKLKSQSQLKEIDIQNSHSSRADDKQDGTDLQPTPKISNNVSAFSLAAV